MSYAPRRRFTWQLRTRSLALGAETKIMGILNVTPDSFSDGGLFASKNHAVSHALAMLEEGAHIIDVGGESTRPNARPLSASDEQARVLPVVGAILKERPNTLISIDTFHASTARAAVYAGVEIVNDVSGFTWDAAMPGTCAELGCGVVLMHTRGRPQEWASLPPLSVREVAPLVVRGLSDSLQLATDASIDEERIVLDPGFGFGKIRRENFPLLAELQHLHQLNHPILSGASRKGFLGAAIKHLHGGVPPPASDRLHATTAANVASVLAGAHILRVHDVRAAAEAAAVADAILAAAEDMA